MRLPYRQRLSIILNELGTGAGRPRRGAAQVIRNADPALKETDKVLAILGDQNRVLAELARDSRPGRWRRWPATAASVADFIEQGEHASRRRRPSAAATSSGTSRSFPAFLRQLRADDGAPRLASDQMTPGADATSARVAPDVNRFIKQLGPFSQAGNPALQRAGRRRRRRPPGARQGRPIVAGPRPVRERRRSRCRRTSGAARRSLQRHRRHRAADGLHLLPGRRDQRLRLGRPLPARAAARQHVLAVHDQLVAGLQRELPGPGHRRGRRGAARAPATSTATPGYADTRRSPGLRRLDAYLRGLDPDKAVPQGAAAADASPAARGRRPTPRPGAARRAAADTGDRRAPRLPDGRLTDAARLGLDRGEPGPHRGGDDARRRSSRSSSPTTRTRACRSCRATS